jgi:hypothetical protein
LLSEEAELVPILTWIGEALLLVGSNHELLVLFFIRENRLRVELTLIHTVLNN